MTIKPTILAGAIALGALTSSASGASAESALSVTDTGPDAIVVARDLELGAGSLKVRSNRIEVALIGKPPAQNVQIDDATIASLGIRIRSTGERRLTITLKGGRDAARRLARRARVEQVNDSVQVILARTVGIEPVAAFIDDLETGDIEIEEEPTAAKPAAAAAAASTNVAPEAPQAGKPESTKSSGGGFGSLIGLIFIFAAAVASGLGYREWQKRRGHAPQTTGIDVLSVKNIGPKTRLMLVAVGNREMLLTVGPSGSTVLGRWRRSEPGGFDDGSDDVRDEFVPREIPAAPPPRSRPLAAPARAAQPLAAPPAPMPTLEPRAARSPRQRTANPAAAALARRAQDSAPAVRRSFARGSATPDDAALEWNHRPTSPAIRGILELRDQTLALEDVLGQGDDDVDTEWEQAIASGTRAGKLR